MIRYLINVMHLRYLLYISLATFCIIIISYYNSVHYSYTIAASISSTKHYVCVPSIILIFDYDELR